MVKLGSDFIKILICAFMRAINNYVKKNLVLMQYTTRKFVSNFKSWPIEHIDLWLAIFKKYTNKHNTILQKISFTVKPI